MLNDSTRYTYKQIYVILNMLDESLVNKIPVKFIQYLEKEKSEDEFNFDPELSIENQLSREAIILFSFINFRYLATNEEKKELLKIYKENEEKYDMMTVDDIMKYDDKNIFQNKSEEHKEINLTVYKKKNIFQRLLDKLSKKKN